MLRSNWRIILTALGLVAFALLGYFAYDKLESADKPAYSQYKYQPARDAIAPPLAKNTKIASAPYQPNCAAPKSRDDADLCAQWASVQAVGESNRITRLSILITGLEFGALIISLFFTGWAALAASKAARIAEEATKDADDAIAIARQSAAAAERQVAISEEASRKELQAYVVIGGLIANGFGPNSAPMFQVQLINTGKTPARNLKASLLFYLLSEGCFPPTQRPDVSQLPSQTIGADKPVHGKIEFEGGRQFLEAEWEALKEGRLKAFAAVYATYEDIFGEPHEVGLHGVVEGLPNKCDVIPVSGTDIFS